MWPWGLQDLSSQTRDQTRVLCSGNAESLATGLPGHSQDFIFLKKKFCMHEKQGVSYSAWYDITVA